MNPKDLIEIKKPPTGLYYLAGVVLLFLFGFAGYYFGYDKYLQKQFGQENQNQNLNLAKAPENTNQNQAMPTQKIYIGSPQENEVIGNPVVIRGRAETMGTITVRIRDANGKILGETTALVEDEARRSDPTNYQTNLPYATSTTEFGLIEVFDYLASDGSIQDLISIKVKFASFGQLPQDEISNWQTYRSEEYGFEVKFPADLTRQGRATTEPEISWDGKLNGTPYVMTLGYISQDTLNTLGVTYCGAHPEDTRCENFKWSNLSATIDWNIETEGAFTQSRAEIYYDDGVVVISIYHSPAQEIKSFFRQILSTFKLIPQ